MGREIKRTPVNFNWPLNKAWFGYKLDSIMCAACGGTGKSEDEIIVGSQIKGGPEAGQWTKRKTHECEVCMGDGTVCPEIEVPEGPGYQLWETVSEGSPISPSFETPEELARWLSSQSTGWFTHNQSYESWLKFINCCGWSPSMVVVDGEIMDGVEAIVKDVLR